MLPAPFLPMVHNALSGAGKSMEKSLTCPRCGKSTLKAEFPDQYEVWLKCSSCRFFMGMSHDEWHHMENSPNINQKIRKMAEKKEK
jgi:predicted  nucleic acid-binding Zn ribbon protein